MFIDGSFELEHLDLFKQSRKSGPGLGSRS